MEIKRSFFSTIAMLTLAAAALPVSAQSAPAAVQPANAAAAAYCVATGGVVQNRRAVYGTNNPASDWLALAGVEQFCQYIASDNSTINLSLMTLYTNSPTLAALAYYAQVPWNGQGNGNPASYYCTQLGGAEIGATSAAGGAWVSKGGADTQLEACVFPDNSVIDSWGLLYHANNITRGIDLATVLRYPNPYVTTRTAK